MSAVNAEIAAAMPWLVAEGESFWEVTGTYRNGGSFIQCLARVVPEWVHGTDEVAFEVLVWGGAQFVEANRITHARRLLLVDARNPREAYWEDDQHELNVGLRRGGQS